MPTEAFQIREITNEQSRDTGMAMVLLFLLLGINLKREGFFLAALVLHLINMIQPQIYKPVARFWLGLSNLLGKVVSNLLLAMVFLIVITPMGILRRLAGKDPLRLREFKAGKGSVMQGRNHTFVGQDIDRPY